MGSHNFLLLDERRHAKCTGLGYACIFVWQLWSSLLNVDCHDIRWISSIRWKLHILSYDADHISLSEPRSGAQASSLFFDAVAIKRPFPPSLKEPSKDSLCLRAIHAFKNFRALQTGGISSVPLPFHRDMSGSERRGNWMKVRPVQPPVSTTDFERCHRSAAQSSPLMTRRMGGC